MRRHVAFSATAWLLLAAASAPAAAPAAPLRVLFIGNSLTAWNDLPALVASMAAAAGYDRPLTQAVVVSGFSLEDHWQRGDAQRVISAGSWDVVILQQGPSALPESRRLLVEYTKRFDALIRQAGGRTALYMVWPSTNRRFDFAGVAQSYHAAAAAVSGQLMSAGEAWRLVLRTDGNPDLYSDDGLHPTLAGSYLAALTIYRGLYPSGTLALPPLGLSATDATRLQAAVRDGR